MKNTVSFAVLLAAVGGSARAAETACEELAKLSLPHTTITSAKPVAKGAFTPPQGAIGGGGAQYANGGEVPGFRQHRRGHQLLLRGALARSHNSL
jgi:hypothetical protein